MSLLRLSRTGLCSKAHPIDSVGKGINGAVVGWNDAADNAHSMDVLLKEFDEVLFLRSKVVLDVVVCEDLLELGNGVLAGVEVRCKILLPDAFRLRAKLLDSVERCGLQDVFGARNVVAIEEGTDDGSCVFAVVVAKPEPGSIL
jgi:hypothetical protein